MSLLVKICGLRDTDGVAAAVAAGADALGFVFAPSPRQIRPEDAAALTAGVPDDILRVAVMRHPSPAEWDHVQEVFAPDWLQTEAEDFATLSLAPGTGRLPVYRGGFPELSPVHGLILFEGPHSGRGELADWQQAAALASTRELLLAGGLAPDNVARAIRTVRPRGVDVSSGVESSPGVKDPTRIAAFVAAAREAELQHVQPDA